jgi:tryptophan-rich sensory protein
MLLNFAWSPIFFGAQAPVPALGVIGAMWLSIAAFIGLEWKADALSARLFLPYLLWVSIATSLNLAIVVLN